MGTEIMLEITASYWNKIFILIILIMSVGYGNLLTDTNKPVPTPTPSTHADIKEVSQQQIEINGKQLYLYNGNGLSMTPTMRGTNQTVIGETNFSLTDIKVGDIVVYIDDKGDRIDHRVVKRNATHFIAKGDNNSYFDPIMPIDRIEAVVVAIIY